jgi:hypothetical protein
MERWDMEGRDAEKKAGSRKKGEGCGRVKSRK